MKHARESRLRRAIVDMGASLYNRGYAIGSSGNISCRTDRGYLVSPTNSCLGRLREDEISLLDAQGNHLDGKPASKEAFLHLQTYRSRADSHAVVHLHSTYAVALSCIEPDNPDNLLPPLTAYYLMKVGRLPLLPYFRPGDMALADAVGECACTHHSMLLANHGSVLAAASLEQAVYAAEELEETARLYFITRGHRVRPLNNAQIEDLQQHFPS